MPSFDIVSEINLEEARNAAENASRELEKRFDFRGVIASIEWKSPTVVVKSESDFQIQQLLDIYRGQLAKRKIDANALNVGTFDHSGKTYSVVVTFKEGIEQPVAKKIVKAIKDSKIKVQAAIQGEQIRVTGKKRDDLQQVMALVRDGEFEQSFQFINFRD